jgi:NTE family protein
MDRPGGAEALVFSGGGALAAYEVGVAKALLRGESPATGYRPVDPEILSGASAGAFNAALLTAAGGSLDLAVAALQRVWLEEVANLPDRCGDGGVFRWRGTPINFFDIDCLPIDPARFFSDRIQDAAFFTQDFVRRADYFLRSRGPYEQRLIELFDFSSLISTAAFPLLIRRVVRLEDIRRSPRVLRIAATNFDTGEIMIFSNADMTEEAGDLIVMASSATPGIFPPVSIPPWTYVDGGVLMNTPLRPAIRAGATTLHAVYLDPHLRNIPLSDLQTTLGTFQRTLMITMAANFNQDIEMARRVNLGLEVLERGGPESLGRQAQVEAASQIAREGERRAPYRFLTIHRYHPHDLLGGPLGVLDFRRTVLESLIERGYQDALQHDCQTAGCVLPPVPGDGESPTSTHRPSGQEGDFHVAEQPQRDRRP